MKHLLSRANREVLQQFAWSNVMLAFDYDGTLAPIVKNPDDALMRPRTRSLLEQLTRLYPCIVISGREQADAIRRLRGSGVLEVVGNHGVEPWAASEKFINEVQEWVPKLEKALAAYSGVNIEDKVFSLAVHYRHAREKKKVRDAVLKLAQRLGKLRIIGGKQVVNLLPQGAPHKGIALERERARLQCDTAVYVGDDETDEDVFSLDQPGQLLSVRVGMNTRSAASYYVKTQAEVDELLQALLELRKRTDVAEARPKAAGKASRSR